MAILPQDKNKRQKYLGFILVAIIIASIFVIRFNFFPSLEHLTSHLPPERPKEVKINFEMLESSSLKKLQPFLIIPPFEGNVGRENPFVSYE